MHSKIWEVDKINSEAYLAELIRKYQNLIFSICYKLTKDYYAAQDLTQETFLSAYLHTDSFLGGNEKAWIARIATNKCIDYEKRASKKVFLTDEPIESTVSNRVELPEQVYMEKESRKRLLFECEKLRKPYDEIAKMYFYEEKDANEIAKLKGANKKTIQTQVYRARDLLRKAYRKESG